MNNYCSYCGEKLEEEGISCPKCNHTHESNSQGPISYPTQPSSIYQRPTDYKSRMDPSKTSNSFGIVGMIFVVLGIFPIPFMSFIFGALSIILGVIGVKNDYSKSIAKFAIFFGIWDIVVVGPIWIVLFSFVK